VTTETFLPATASPWTCPAGVTVVQVEMWGGGGRGSTRTTNGGGGGGGGGAYSSLNAYAVTPGNTYAFQVGVGSSAGTSGATNDTWWVTTAVGLAKAGASVVNDTATGGAGGASGSGVGDVKNSGGAGGTGVTGTNGGGGGEAGGASGTGAAGSGATGGSGVNAVGGDGGAGAVTNNGGTNGAVFGGGGGGALRTGGATQAGGFGGNGRIVLTYSTSVDLTATGAPLLLSAGTASLDTTTTTAVVPFVGMGAHVPYTRAW
jgi:hypothetical protein